MKKMKNLALVLILGFALSCQSNIHREPSSVAEAGEWKNLKNLKQRKIELNALSIHFHKKKNEVQLAKIQDEQLSIDKKIKEIESSNKREVSQSL